MLEQRPQTLAEAYDIARRHETTKQTAFYFTNRMHPGTHNVAERRPRAAVIREAAEEEPTETAATEQETRWRPEPASPSPYPPHTFSNQTFTPSKQKDRKDINWEEIHCHNCSGLGHMRRNCPSPKKTTKAQVLSASQPGSVSLEVCAVLDSGARKSVLPLHHYNAVHPEVRPPLQPSVVTSVVGIGPGDIPVVGEANFPVQINKRQVSIHFLVADIASEEALLGHPFLVQSKARLDYGTNRMVLFGEEVPSFQPHSKPPLRAVRVSRTVVVEPGREFLVPGCTRFKGQFKGEVMLSPTKGFVEKHRLLVRPNTCKSSML
ncbi:hypothetical protein NHX12_015871 [Muraenolepis orangiensis]|uniref:CCHC-type domain-containing protein n=1 Tax=Muraenolepis orangiensis TaxID=630683 RepID=A0A9Q0D536_9TELE|nr:hypothetical protein NHX12_015871 [Muraenolepis orangiensis]